jgi:hypothetical protein
MVGAVGHP